jgi:hypothetical protein
MSALASVNIDLDTAFFGATRSLAYQLSLNVAELGAGMLGAFVVILAGALWRRAQANAPDEKP